MELKFLISVLCLALTVFHTVIMYNKPLQINKHVQDLRWSLTIFLLSLLVYINVSQ